MNLPHRVLVSLTVCLVSFACPPPPGVNACDRTTGEDCDAGVPPSPDAGSLEDGTWTLSIVLDQPSGTPGRILTTEFNQLRATMPGVKLVKVADAGYGLEIPGNLGLCCSPLPTLTTDLRFPAQSFTVLAGTPMNITMGSGPEMSYRSLDTWRVTMEETVQGRWSDRNLRFDRGRGRMFDQPSNTTNPIQYFSTIELRR